MALQIELIQGTSADYPIQIPNRDGSPAINIFQSSDVLSCKAWTGQDQAVLFQPTISWLNGSYANGIIQVSFNNADTVGWFPGIYRIQAYATRGGRTSTIADFSLKLLYSPGVATTLPVYSSLQDLLRYCRWIQQLSIFQTDETGFLTQRNEARQWLENLVQRHYRLTAGLNLQTFGNPVPSWGPRRTGGYSKYLQGLLDSNYLMVDPPRRVKEICSKYAAFLVLQDIISGTGSKDSWYRDKSNWMMDECNNLIKGYTAEIDIAPQDGYPEITVEMCLVDVLRGG